jgi:hypothetical protein
MKHMHIEPDIGKLLANRIIRKAFDNQIKKSYRVNFFRLRVGISVIDLKSFFNMSPNFVLKACKWTGYKISMLYQYIIEIKLVRFNPEGFTVNNCQVPMSVYNVFEG